MLGIAGWPTRCGVSANCTSWSASMPTTRGSGRRHRDRPGAVVLAGGAGYEVYAINPMAVARYRDRHGVSGAKSDPGDAKVLADLVRTDRHNHRPVAGDKELVEGIKVLARAHQTHLGPPAPDQRLALGAAGVLPGRPGGLRHGPLQHDAIAVLSIAPTPALGRRLSGSKIASALRRGGRQRNVEHGPGDPDALRAEQLEAPPMIADAYGIVARSVLGLIGPSRPRSPSWKRRWPRF